MDAAQQALLKRITIIPGLLNGKSTIRGLRFPVSDILELLSSGLTEAEILEDHPILEQDDIRAALLYFYTIPEYMQTGIKQGITDIQKGDVFTFEDFENKYKQFLT